MSTVDSSTASYHVTCFIQSNEQVAQDTHITSSLENLRGILLAEDMKETIVEGVVSNCSKLCKHWLLFYAVRPCLFIGLWSKRGPRLKLPAWKFDDRVFEPHSGLQYSKKQNVSYPLTRKDVIFWRASVTER